MINRTLMLLLTGFLVACSSPPAVQAKSSAPVEIEYSTPDKIQAGDEATTVIRFTAKTDLQTLTISASPYSGIELLSGGDSIEFANLKSGDAREITVSIRLIDELGYLSVFAATTDSRGNTQSKSIAVRYGAAGEATIRKIQSRGLTENPTGEKLILMPGEAR